MTGLGPKCLGRQEERRRQAPPSERRQKMTDSCLENEGMKQIHNEEHITENHTAL